jgi:putative chitinase
VITLTPEKLLAIMPKCPSAMVNSYCTSMRLAMQEAAISTVLRASAWIANIALETGELRWWEENLNYSAQAICDTWPQRFPTISDAIPYAHAPQLLANRVYCDRMGNGPQSSGDGWTYRGRGPSQTTGKEEYDKLGDLLGINLVAHPELAASPEYGFQIAALYWLSKGMEAPADAGDFLTIVKLWNGGYNGLAQRQAYYDRCRNVLAA